MFIKPADLGSSFGCERALTPEEFLPAYRSSRRVSERILIEEYLEGARELECAYLGTCTRGELFTHPGEVIVGDVYTYEKKYSKASDAKILTRAPLDEDTVTRVKNYSRRLVSMLGIRHLARIDFFLYGGEVIFNEINTMPGFTASSLYPRMLEAAGIPPRELVSELIEEAAW
jgi:D-alanine-D-alanine ligase